MTSSAVHQISNNSLYQTRCLSLLEDASTLLTIEAKSYYPSLSVSTSSINQEKVTQIQGCW